MTHHPAMASLDIALLGTFQVTVNDATVTGFRTDKMRALLAYLCVEAARPHRRDALMGLLWPDQPKEAASVSLRQALFKLRQILGEPREPDAAPGWLLVTPLTVQFNPVSAHQLDVTTFRALLAACHAHRHRKPAWCTTCHAYLQQAAALYRGDFLQGFFLEDSQPFDEWLVLHREGLRRDALEVFGLLAAYHEGRAEYPSALQYTYRQIDLEPWDEELHRQAMWLLAVTGRRSAALAQYQTCKQRLAADLEVAPTTETTALFERIRAGTLDDNERAAAAVLRRHNLPPQLTPFIGRAADLPRLAALLENPDYRLITLVGPGGVGKTRLAVRAAEAQVGAFADGIYWVPLAAVPPTARLPPVLAGIIAQAVGLQFHGHDEPQAQLLQYLQDKEMLLVLDNFEHLLGVPEDARAWRAEGAAGQRRLNEASDLLRSILQHAPQVSILITSRERLGLQAEYLLDLAGMTFPTAGTGNQPRARALDAGPLPADAPHPVADNDRYADLAAYSAVQLFVERARAVRADFVLSDETGQGVEDICRLVAGLPLGIVLAAAWVRHFSPAHIAGAIQANLDFLTSSAQDAAPQHTSLRAVFNHSWALLPAGEREIVRHLSVFRGGWDAAAAERVTGATVYDLLSLVDKSLLRQDQAGRFDSHEVLRQYAAEKLDEAPQEHAAIQRRHAEYYLELAELAEARLRGDEQAGWLARLEHEHDNLRAALQWARDTDALEIGLRLGGALWRFWYVRGYFSEGRAQLAAVLEMAATQDGPVMLPAGGPSPAEQQTPPPPIAAILAAKAKVLHGAGALASMQGATRAGRTFYEQSLALRRALGDWRGVATSLNNLGLLVYGLGDYADARALHEESLALRRELRDQGGVASSLTNLGILAYQQGDYAAAQALYTESLALRRELGDKESIAHLSSNLGIIAQSCGDYDTARARHEESLILMRGLGNQHGIATALISLGIVAQNQEHYAAAHAWHDESLALSREMGDQARVALALHHLGVVAQMRGDTATAHTLYRESLTLYREIGDKGGIAASLNNLGLLAHGAGDVATAHTLHRESLALRWELGELRGVAACLAGLGGVAVSRARQAAVDSPAGRPAPPGPWEESARLFGVVAGLLERMGGVLDIEDRQLYTHNLAVVRGELSTEAFVQSWAMGQAMQFEQAISLALSEPDLSGPENNDFERRLVI